MKEYYQFFNLKIIMLNCNKAVTPFAMIIDKLPIRTPYTNQRMTPINKIMYIVREIPTAFFSLYILYTCGINADVVRKAADSPIISNTGSII